MRRKAPMLVQITTTYDSIANLQTLSFADGSRTADDYWDFVSACRLTSHAHRADPLCWFDVVIGPLATIWKSRVVKQSSDQISFHSMKAQEFLNRQQFSIQAP